MNIAVIGTAFGDEGKARIVNYLAHDRKYVVRFGGSSNAGHTFYYKNKKIVRHLLPSADFSIPDQHAVLAAGMVINPLELLQEVREAEAMFPGSGKRIIVDPDAFVITGEHVKEDKQNVKSFGSTGKGVSVAYRDKIYRKGTKIRDLIRDDQPIIAALKKIGVQFRFNLEMYNEFSKAPILFEGAQAALLDINFGTYPYVTSGECTPAGIFSSGFSYAMPEKVIGITKAYSTRVGEGPFPTEIFGDEAERLRKNGNEFGATTGRPRRVGWLDLPMLRYACIKSGITELAITKMDILAGRDEIKICTKYEKAPVSSADFFNTVVKYGFIPGWEDSKNGDETSEFIELIEEFTDVPVKYLSCGTSEEDIVSL